MSEPPLAIELENWLDGLDRRHFDVEGSAVTCWFGDKGSTRKQVVRLQVLSDGVRFEADGGRIPCLPASDAAEADRMELVLTGKDLR
jgi:hypothetical protein